MQQRKISDSDLEAIFQVGHASFTNFHTREKFLKKIEDRKYWTLILRESSEPVAFKVWYEDEDQEIYSWLGAVHPDHRKKGIATEMMHMQFRYMAGLGYNKVKLKTHEGHPEMIALCKKEGFIEVGREPKHWGDEREAIFFEYDLTE